MITKIEEKNGLYFLENKVIKGYTCCGNSDREFYDYNIIICNNIEELKKELSKWGYTPVEAYEQYDKYRINIDVHKGLF